MKKLLLAGILLLASASLTTMQAGKKKDKKKKKEHAEMTQAVHLTSSADSLSYAAGYTATMGLLGYLQNQLHVDTTYLADFARGYREMLAKADDPAYVAYITGTQIAGQAKNQIFPGMSKGFQGTADSLRATAFHEGFLAGVNEDLSLIHI